MTRRAALTLGILTAALVGAVAFRLLVGGDTLHWPESDQIWALRGQRTLAGLVIGAALAVAGVMLQSLLRNPLASPDLLGLASGAGLGVMISTYIAYRAGHGLAQADGHALPALLGALGALAVVYALGQRRGLIDPVSLILVGVVVAMICSAGTMFIQYLMPDRGAAASRWLLGAINDEAGPTQIATVGLATAGAIAVGLWLAPAMDAASLSEDEARSVGVRLSTLRITLFIGSGVLAAGSVLLAGPIGFVGLICPHLVRLMAGPAHRVLIIGAALAGAALIVGADGFVKAVDLGAGRLPIGVLTAIIGGPLFIVLLRQSQRRML